jgi:hypothetical protein
LSLKEPREDLSKGQLDMPKLRGRTELGRARTELKLAMLEGNKWKVAGRVCGKPGGAR